MSSSSNQRAGGLFLTCVALLCNYATAQSDGVQAGDKRQQRSAQADGPAGRAGERVRDALGVVRQLEAEPRIRSVLKQAKGVLIVPAYGRAALGIGAQGGGGLLLFKLDDGTWSGPAFYDLGGLTVGLQAGVEGGALAIILNNEKAVKEFMKKNNLALTADAGLTVLNWSKLAQGTAGTGDVIVWSASKGVFGDAVAVGIHDIRYDQNMTNAYYGRALSPADIADSKIFNAEATPLRQALGAASSSIR